MASDKVLQDSKTVGQETSGNPKEKVVLDQAHHKMFVKYDKTTKIFYMESPKELISILFLMAQKLPAEAVVIHVDNERVQLKANLDEHFSISNIINEE